MNNLESWEKCQDSYFFGRRGSIWGWASWSRVVLDWREQYDWVNDTEYIKQLEKTWKPYRNWKGILKRYRYCATTGKAYFEVLLCERMLRSNSLNIIPKENMIRNVGMLGGTHSNIELKMYPRFYRKWMNMKQYEIIGEIKHPCEVVQDTVFDRKMDPNPLQQFLLRSERILLQLIHGNGKELFKKGIKKIQKLKYKNEM